jgi:rRNA maturation protein Nop10
VKKDTPRILVVDIETAPLESYTWGTHEQNVGVDQIKREWSILAFCAKWLGESKLIYDDTGGRGVKKVRDDKKLLKKLHKLLDEADIVVTQNGKKFDLRKINARLIMAGFKPYSPIRFVDTYLVARKHFGFTSNRLAWQSQHLTDTPKSTHKRFPGFELWLECLADNPAAWAEMKKYNCRDVVATEKVYLKQLPWITGHPNVGAYTEKPHCPKCGSRTLQARGTQVTQQGRYQRFQCNTCGGWSRGKKTKLSGAAREALLVN